MYRKVAKLMTYDFLETLYQDLLRMIDKLVVKRSDLARENETTESLKYGC